MLVFIGFHLFLREHVAFLLSDPCIYTKGIDEDVKTACIPGLVIVYFVMVCISRSKESCN